MVRNDNVDFQELTQLISTDPALSSLLISLSNSPIYGTINRRIDSLHRAILILGRDHVVEVVMVHIMRSMKDMVQTSWPKGDILFWQHSTAVAIVARSLASKLSLPFSQQALLAGLLHDLGKLLLLNHYTEQYKKILDQAHHALMPLHLLESEYLGLTHAEVGGGVCSNWNFPDEFVNTIARHHDETSISADSLGNIVQNANFLVKVAGIGESGNCFVPAAKLSLLPHTQINWSSLQELLHDLPMLVYELTSFIFGTKTAECVGPRNTSSMVRELRIYLSIQNVNEQLLARYALAALGYATYANAENEEHLPPDTDAILTDRPDHFPHGRYTIVNYEEWRANQDDYPNNELDVMSLKAWMDKQLKHEMGVRMLS